MPEKPETNPAPVDIERYLEMYDERLRTHLVREALRARDELAVSHRGFLVGCSVVGVKKNGYGFEETGYFSAGNYTPEPKAKPPEAKWCAERVVVNLATHENATFIIAIVTVSSEVDRGEGGPVHDVLHSCPECRGMFRALMEEGIISPQTRVCHVRDDGKGNIQAMEELTIEAWFKKLEKVDLPQ